MSGILKLPHSCPNCKKVIAHTYKELDEKFGFRNVPTGTTNQSWCRHCRSKHS